MKIRNQVQIGIIGDSQIRSERQYEIAYEIGQEIARANAILVCGGRGGVMEAACKGAFENNGITVGILPTDVMIDPEVNPYLTIRIPTFLHWTRNSLVPLASDGVIAVGGQAGTLTEIAYSWINHKPMVCITSINGWSREIGERGYIDEREGRKIMTAETGMAAVQQILSAISASK
ncbi:MAG: TIGR00725 family protein [Candidatus Thorarchaeota archaeon]